MKNDVVEELFVKYYNDALLYVLSLSGNKALAEDAVSTAFFKALRGGDGEIKSFKPWLMKVCRNVCFDMLKHRKRYAAIDESMKDESENAVDKIIRDERYKALYRAIELLPDTQKEAVLLYRRTYSKTLRVTEKRKIT
ncbi:MAG: RNA polymerase sigma factor [Lachnospiraceae bacterium]